MPTDDDFLIDDILTNNNENLETEYRPKARAHKISARQRYERILAQQALAEVVPEAPAAGESIHVLSDARFDFWTWVPQMADWLPGAVTLYCSTWTVSRQNVVELFSLWDRGKFRDVAFLTGLYFKRRESAVYATLLQGLRDRGGRYRCSPNHTKVLLLADDAGNYLTCEGSANLTSNPRLEQYVITNDRSLYEFHREWMEELLAR